jgi:hypothetical protein
MSRRGGCWWIWGSHSSEYEQRTYYLMGYDPVYFYRSLSKFPRNAQPPSSGWPDDFLLLAHCLLRIYTTLKMCAIRSSVTSVCFYPTTRRHIPENGTFWLEWMTVFCESGLWWNQPWPISRYYPSNRLQRARETMQIFSQDSRCFGRDKLKNLPITNQECYCFRFIAR